MLKRFWNLFVSRQFLTFVLVGGSGFIVNLGITVALTELAKIFYFISYVIAALASWTFMFFVHARFTFRGHGAPSIKKAYLQFVGWYAAVMLANFTLVYVLTSILGLYYVASIVFVTGTIAMLSFLFNRLVVFRPSTAESSPQE